MAEISHFYLNGWAISNRTTCTPRRFRKSRGVSSVGLQKADLPADHGPAAGELENQRVIIRVGEAETGTRCTLVDLGE